MNKIITLSRKSIKNNRVYKIISNNGKISNKAKVKIGLLEYNYNGDQNLFLNVNLFYIDFLRGAEISKKLLSNLKHSNLIKSPWFLNKIV